MADCDHNPGTGCEANLSNDPRNCGQCGNTCVGGSCTNSGCVLAQPGTLTYTFGDFECIATDGINVYFTAANVNSAGGSDILYVPTGGGTVTQLPSSMGMRGAGLTVYGNFVYWADYAAGKILETPKAGQSGSTRTVISGLTNPLRVAADTANVYWSSKVGAGAVSRTLATTATTPAWSANQTGGSAWGLTIDGANVYYTDPTLGDVVQLDIATGMPVSVTPCQPGSKGLASDANNIYWTTSSGNVVMSAKPTITPTVIAQGQPNPQEITVGGGVTPPVVYWADVGPGGSVNKAPAVSSASVNVVAPAQAAVQCVAVDSTSVYWATYGGTQILKAPR
jgi:hypothetical protein